MSEEASVAAGRDCVICHTMMNANGTRHAPRAVQHCDMDGEITLYYTSSPVNHKFIQYAYIIKTNQKSIQYYRLTINLYSLHTYIHHTGTLVTAKRLGITQSPLTENLLLLTRMLQSPT